jgi:hypothetical protein
MSLFTRNLEKHGKSVTIEDRNEAIISGKSSIVFSNSRIDKALISTLKGVSVYDSTNTKQEATHKISMVWRDDVGAEQFIRRTDSTKRLRILTAENCCEKDRVLILMCTERGEDSKIVNNS